MFEAVQTASRVIVGDPKLRYTKISSRTEHRAKELSYVPVNQPSNAPIPWLRHWIGLFAPSAAHMSSAIRDCAKHIYFFPSSPLFHANPSINSGRQLWGAFFPLQATMLPRSTEQSTATQRNLAVLDVCPHVAMGASICQSRPSHVKRNPR